MFRVQILLQFSWTVSLAPLTAVRSRLHKALISSLVNIFLSSLAGEAVACWVTYFRKRATFWLRSRSDTSSQSSSADSASALGFSTLAGSSSLTFSSSLSTGTWSLDASSGSGTWETRWSADEARLPAGLL